jgi:Beta-propeller repeat
MTLARTLPKRTLATRLLWRTSAVMAASLAALPAAAQNQVWITQLGTNTSDFAFAAAMDGSGGVYVSGGTGGSLGGPRAGAADVWLAHYDGAGNQGWIRQLGTSSADDARAAAMDGSGGVYVSGSTGGSLGGSNAGIGDAWLARYDRAGNQTWIRQLGTSGEDEARAAATDGAGGVYVGGSTVGSLGGPNAGSGDAWLARYDSAGNQLWIRQLGTSGIDVAQAAAPDRSGGVYVSGRTHGSLGGPTAGSVDAWLARYDSAGNQLWIRQLGTSSVDAAYAAAPDGSGGVYVSGETGGSLGGPGAGAADVWLAHYDGAGNQGWIQQFGTVDGESAYAAAPQGAGGVYVGGYTFGSLGGTNVGGYDSWLARYDGPCGASSSYCTSSTTSIPGCQAAIGAVGSPSLANPGGFTISSGSVPGGGNVGICFFGKNGAASIPFGTLGGQICVQPPFFRSKPRLSGGTSGTCNGAFAFTLQDLIDTSPIIVQGAVINAEIWGRDPANSDGFLLSNGLQLTVCP